MSRILHILDRLNGGGPTRSMIALAKYQRAAGMEHIHHCVSLTAPAYPVALILARQAGVAVVMEPSHTDLCREIEQADIVQVSFWNNPVLYGFLRQPLPPMRLLLWMKVFGDKPPQVITPKLVEAAACCVVTAAGSLELPVLRDKPAPLIEAPADYDRVSSALPLPHAGFNVSTIGTLNFGKLHPQFVSMSAAADIANVQFIVCGTEYKPLQQQAGNIGAESKFDFRGFVENIQSVLSMSDVFGYPLCVDTYATTEKSLREAMWAGVPPVVFPYGGVASQVIDGQTGLIVKTEAEYSAALETLYRQPNLRRRLGQQAQDYARANFDAKIPAGQFNSLYAALIEQSKNTVSWPAADDDTPSGRFIDALGHAADPFITSKTSDDADRQQSADQQIAASSLLLAQGEGSIIHYRNTFPDDAYLHYWSALVLISQHRYDTARRELDAAAHYGLNGVYERRFVQTAFPMSLP